MDDLLIGIRCIVLWEKWTDGGGHGHAHDHDERGQVSVAALPPGAGNKIHKMKEIKEGWKEEVGEGREVEEDEEVGEGEVEEDDVVSLLI